LSDTPTLDTRIAVLEERVKNREDALRLQAVEYQRRLDDLNHAHQMAQERNSEFVRIGTYGSDVGALQKWRDEVNVVIAQLQGATRGTRSVWDLFFQILPLLVSLAVLGGMIWPRKP
jgi:hypothetical protein